MYRKIEVFGDSLLKGVQIDPKTKKYYVNNKMDLAEISTKHLLQINNRSQFGCTVLKGKSMLEGHLQKGLQCDYIVMDYGGNDCNFDWAAIAANPNAEHLPKTPLKIFKETYHKIIAKLKALDIRPILTNLPPIEPKKFFHWFFKGLNKKNILKWLGLGGINEIYRYQESYSCAVEEIAKETGVPIVDLRSPFLEHGKLGTLICDDGIHLNTEGQKLISESFLKFADYTACANKPTIS